MRTILLTPGPLTTSDATRAAMARDWGSRDQDFIALSESVRTRLGAIVHAGATHETVPLQGAGTYAVEAAIATLVPRDGKLLVLVNGAYGRRAAEMAARMGRQVTTLEWPEDQAVDPATVAAALRDDPAVTDVLVVHLETTSGLLNPLAPIAQAVAQAGRRLLLDAMASFGALPIDLRDTPCAAVMASANKCLESVPGIAFVIAEATHLAAVAGNSPTTSLDLAAQSAGFRANRQWRFTPPTHVVAALAAALDQLEAEGGPPARLARYQRHMTALTQGMRRLGFTPYLPETLQGPIILTLRDPGGAFRFEDLYQSLHAQGIVLYPGKLTQESSFRIGCIGAIGIEDIERTLHAVEAWRHAAPTAPARPAMVPAPAG